jgi:hypothetical protein
MNHCSDTLEPALTVEKVSATNGVLIVFQLAIIEIGHACGRCTACGYLQLVGVKSDSDVTAEAPVYLRSDDKDEKFVIVGLQFALQSLGLDLSQRPFSKHFPLPF